MKKLTSLLMMLGLLSACDNALIYQLMAQRSPTAPPESVEQINEEDVEPEIEYPEIIPYVPEPFVKIYEDDREIVYEGNVIIRGRYYEESIMNLLGEVPCFYTDSRDADKIPLYWEPDEEPLFCFSYPWETVRAMFEIQNEVVFADESVAYIEIPATIELSQFTLSKTDGEVGISATLSRVISKEPYKTFYWDENRNVIEKD